MVVLTLDLVVNIDHDGDEVLLRTAGGHIGVADGPRPVLGLLKHLVDAGLNGQVNALLQVGVPGRAGARR